MVFCLKKCGAIIFKRAELTQFEGINLNQETRKMVDENGYTYLGVLQVDGLTEKEMKEKKTEYKSRIRLVMKSKLNGRNNIQAENTWAVAKLQYGAGIIDWEIDELRQLERRGRR